MAALGHTVDSGSGASGNYASLNALEAAQEQDLTDGGGDTYTATCTTTGDNAADTTTTEFVGWTTGATTYIQIEAASGDEAVIGSFDTSRYRLSVSAGNSLKISEEYVRLVHLQIETDQSHGSAADTVYISIGAPSSIQIDSCRIRGKNAGAVPTALKVGGGTVDIFNSIIYGSDSALDIRWVVANPTVNIYNNTITSGGNTNGINVASGTATAKNNAVFNNSNDFNGTVTADYNASDDEDGTNSQKMVATDDWAAEFVDAAGGDFTLVVGSVCIENGIDNPGSGLYSDDIEGTARSSTWDIGAFEYVAPAGGIVVLRRRRM